MTSTAHDQHTVSYQPHIDGLRAIAVLAVIANHFNKNLLPGGYLGVDVFFVISGFVITSSLMSKPRESLGPFLLAFFQRRIKRLLPALLVCVLVTSVAICALDPQPRNSLMTGISALFGIANIHLYQQSLDYFAPAAQSNAFTHTWSLGVEEQFYLVYPFLFWLATGARTGNPRRVLVLLIGGLSLVSFVAFARTFATLPSAAYFISPFRFWELGFGCLVCAGRDSPLARWLRRATEPISLVLLLGLVACLWTPARYLVPASSVVVLLTGLLLLAPSGLGRTVLTWQPLRYIGLISYSLYLWHWSVLVLARWSIGIDRSSAVWLLVTMFLLAVASYRWVEAPMRRRAWRRPMTFGLGASLAGAAAILLLTTQYPQLLRPTDPSLKSPPAFLPVKNQPYNPRCVVDGHERLLAADTFDSCTFQPRAPSQQTLWAMGDSHAGHLQGMLYKLHEDTGIGVHLIETPGLPYPYDGPDFEPRERIVEAVMARARPGDILLVSRLYFYRGSTEPVTHLPAWSDKLLALARKLEQRQMHLVVVGPPPMFDFEHTVVCLRTVFSNNACEQDRQGMAARVDEVHQRLEQSLATQSNAQVFRAFDILCPPDQKTCTPMRENTMLFRDRDHLNTAGSALLAEPIARLLSSRGVLRP